MTMDAHLFIVVHLSNGDRPMFRMTSGRTVGQELDRVHHAIDARALLEDIEGRYHLLSPAHVVNITTAPDD